MIVLFHVGLARLFVGVVLSEFHVELPFFFFERRQGELCVGLTQCFVGVTLSESGGNIVVGLGRQVLWLGVELAQFFVLFSEPPVLGFSIVLFA